MKKIGLLILFVKLSSLANAQTISVDMLYSLPPKSDSIAAHNKFFTAHFVSDFTGKSFSEMQIISAKHVSNSLIAKKAVHNYSLNDIGLIYSSDFPISFSRNLGAAFYNQPTSKIGVLNYYDPANDFKLVNGFFQSDKITFTYDYKFQTASDTQLVSSKNGKKFTPIIVHRFMDPEQAALLFSESWNFDMLTGHFTKGINQVGYLERKVDSYEPVIYRWTMVIDNGDSVGLNKQDVLIKENVITEVAINKPYSILEYDTSYSQIDGRDAANVLVGTIGNLADADRAKFLSAIFTYAYAHPEKVFPNKKENGVDLLHPFKTVEQLDAIFQRKDSLDIEDQFGNILTQVFTTEISLSSIYAIRFYEDWYYDPKEMVIKKSVKGIGFVRTFENPQTGNGEISDLGIYIKLN